MAFIDRVDSPALMSSFKAGTSLLAKELLLGVGLNRDLKVLAKLPCYYGITSPIPSGLHWV